MRLQASLWLNSQLRVGVAWPTRPTHPAADGGLHAACGGCARPRGRPWAATGQRGEGGRTLRLSCNSLLPAGLAAMRSGPANTLSRQMFGSWLHRPMLITRSPVAVIARSASTAATEVRCSCACGGWTLCVRRSVLSCAASVFWQRIARTRNIGISAHIDRYQLCTHSCPTHLSNVSPTLLALAMAVQRQNYANRAGPVLHWSNPVNPRGTFKSSAHLRDIWVCFSATFDAYGRAGPREGWSRRHNGQYGTRARERDHNTVSRDVLYMERPCRQCD